jgi:hypothetical protein
MLQTVNSLGQASWPTSIAEPIVRTTEKSKLRSYTRREVDLQTPSASDVALLYPAVVVSSDAFACLTRPLNSFAAQLERDGSTDFGQSLHRVEPVRTSLSERRSW